MELGGEVSYQPKRWLRVEVGGFRSKNLKEALDSRPNDRPNNAGNFASVGRLTLLHQFSLSAAEEKDDFDDDFDDDFGDDFGDDPEPSEPININTWLGTSFFQSGDFRMINGFLGFGMPQGISGVAEIAFTRFGSNDTIETLNTMNLFYSVSYAVKE